MKSGVPHPQSIPEIVSIVITQAVRGRARGESLDAAFEARLQRLRREELEPLGLALLVRELADGRCRFIVKDMETGAVRTMLDFSEGETLQGPKLNSPANVPQPGAEPVHA
jgi:hypothetical protein